MPILQAQPFNAFAEGRQLRQQEDYGNTRNALANLELQNAPEQMRTRNALAQQQVQGGQQELDANKSKYAYTQLAQALQSGNPKAFVLQNIPDLANNLKTHGVDLATMDDQAAGQMVDQLAKKYAGLAGVMPTPQMQTIGDTSNPGAGLYQKNPTTGEIKQVTAPQRPDLSQEKLNEDIRHNKAMEANGSAGGKNGDTYDPTTLRTAAIVVASDPARLRDYASYGQAGQAARIAIQKEITQLKKETGLTDGELVQLRNSAKAQAKSVEVMTKQQNALATFEGLAKANGQRVLDLIDLVDQTGIPMIEGFTRSARAKAGGVDVAELKSVLTAFQAETSRILSNPDMKGVVSDSARHEVQAMAPESMSSAQAKRVINRIFTEMDIRTNLLQDQIGKASAATVVGSPPSPQLPSQPTAVPQPEVTATGPNGQRIVLRNGQWVPLGR